MINKRFHYLLVVSELQPAQFKSTSCRRYLCVCDCGNEVTALRPNLLRGATKSCGCWKKKTAGDGVRTHGMSKSSEYEIWVGIKKRCTNPNQKDFYIWGGKGISMCDSWSSSFEAFYSDMGSRPSKDHSIDRIDSDKNYEPENCRWATDLEQSLNSSRVRKFIRNEDVMSLRQIATLEGISYFTLYDKVVRRKLPIEQLLPNCRSAI